MPTYSPVAPPVAAPERPLLAPWARLFLEQLVTTGLLDAADRETFLSERLDRLREFTNLDRLTQALIRAKLLTPYQAQRLLVGAAHGLMLGGYRVLEELGRGGMGTVYLAEHRLMKRRVAVKVLPVDEECPLSLRQRFFSEMRLLAELSHPNVVAALDAGEVPGEIGQAPIVYLVMEWIDGGDLEKFTTRQGVLDVPRACSFIRQAATGLQAAHDRHLVHRDIKPSNLLLTASGQIKLVDFGLARQFSSRLTDPRTLLGSVEFMPPEQSHDPSAVGKEADIYGLGSTLFWLLTGEGPYPYHPHVGQSLRLLQQQDPRRLRSLRPDVPAALDELVANMLHRNPAQRPSSPLAVVNALEPFTASRRATPSPDRVGQLTEQLARANEQLEQSLRARATDLREAHNALLFTVAKIAESRDGETPGHLERMKRYTRTLALEAATGAPWKGLVDDRFLEQLDRCVPLHDIGKIGLPDDILLKPATLTAAERTLVETHSVIGDRILEALSDEYGAALDFLGMARVIVRHHHERHDGKGYPDRLAGDAIPPAARLVAVADVYDAMRRMRLYKPAMTHRCVIHLLLEKSEGQFDPDLVAALGRCQEEFEKIYREIEE